MSSSGRAMKAKGSRKRRWWLLVLVLLPTCALLIPIRAHFRMKAMESRASELTALAKERETRRSVLRGEPLPGNAWDYYREALKNAKTMDVSSTLDDFVQNRENVDHQKIEHARAAEPAGRGDPSGRAAPRS